MYILRSLNSLIVLEISHFNEYHVKEGLITQRIDEDNIKNDSIYVKGKEEVEDIIEKVEEDDTETEKDEDEYFSESSEEEVDASQEVQRKTQAKGIKKTVVNEGFSIKSEASISMGAFVAKNVGDRRCKQQKIYL